MDQTMIPPHVAQAMGTQPNRGINNRGMNSRGVNYRDINNRGVNYRGTTYRNTKIGARTSSHDA